MDSHAYHADGVGRIFGLPAAPVLTAQPLQIEGFSVTRIDRDVAAGDVQEIVLPPSPCYFMMLYLQAVSHADIDAAGVEGPVRTFPEGTICLVDLQEGASIALHSGLHSLAFTLPKPLFQQVAELSKTQHLQRLRCKRAHHDPVVSNIGLALSSLFSSSPSSATAVVRHVAVALCQHLITNYGVADQVCESDSGDEQGLVGWQNTAFAFIQDNLGRNVTVAMIADAVRLSPSHFARLFKAATGVTVHQWLVRRRLERAQDLLHDPSLRLGQIAGICGFCDESHFRKVFVHHLGVTPTDWRRTRLH